MMELDDYCQCCHIALPQNEVRYRCQACYDAGECGRSGALGKCRAHCEHCKTQAEEVDNASNQA